MGLTVSLAPITSVTSVSLKSSLISSISSTTWYNIQSNEEKAEECGKLTIIGNRCLGEKYVALPRHTPCDWMNSKLRSACTWLNSEGLFVRIVKAYPNINPFGPEKGGNFGDGILCLRHSHSIPDDLHAEREALSIGVQYGTSIATKITLSALASASTVSSTVVLVIEPSILVSVVPTIELIPPKSTFVRERFIATHCVTWIRHRN